MIDKKQAKQDYRNYVPPKGIFGIVNRKTGRTFLVGSLNLYNIADRTRFRLTMGNYPCARLLRDWKELGEESFSLEILETLPLKDDPAYDYDEDLKILEMIWLEKYRPLAEKAYNEKDEIRLV